MKKENQKKIKLSKLVGLANGKLEGGFEAISINQQLLIIGGEGSNNCNGGNCVAGCGQINNVAGCGTTNIVAGCGA